MATDRLLLRQIVDIYATVLFEAVGPDGDERLLRVYSEMDQILKVFRTDIELLTTLADTEFTDDQREALCRGVFVSADPALVDVLAVMAHRGQVRLLPRVRNGYERLMADRCNLTVVDVTTAVSLDDELRGLIKAKAESDLGTRVVLRESLDPNILGGFVMSSGGKRIDASVATRLSSARQQLKQRTYGGESS